MANKEKCPICGKPPQKKFMPFCSKRCAHVDLGNWLGERYVIPGASQETEEPDTPENGDEN